MVGIYGIDGYSLHSFHIFSLAFFVFLGFDLLVPFELVVGEEGLIVGDGDGSCIPCKTLGCSELVNSRKVRKHCESTACEGDVLIDLEAKPVLEIVGADVAEYACFRILKQCQRAVEIHYITA